MKDKMTYKEIVKGLECCQREYGKNCKECPYHKYTITGCRVGLREDTLNLVYHMQETIDSLQTELDLARKEAEAEISSMHCKYDKALDTVRSETIKKFEEKAVKLIRTKASNLKLFQSLYTDQSARALEGVAEAITDLAIEMEGE